MQLGFALLQREGVGAGVACGSHLGGLVAGACIAFALRLHVDGAVELRFHRGRRYLDQALWYPAQGEFIEYVRRQPTDVQGHLELARTYRLTGRQPQADHHYRTACRLAAQAKRLDQVEEFYIEAEKGNSHFALEPPLQLQLAQVLEKSLKAEAAARAWGRFADSAPRAAQAPLALYRAARLAAQTGGEQHAIRLLQRLSETYPEAPESALAEDDLRQLDSAQLVAA
jgi:tetratricopeptide (TPR) repeat protein